ncbi:hypothetical protein GX50_08851 [[Emmonsia] crescens]|uniref:Uncharacterized protein n=1 Tax=[Emmonsia] crescens TaxID=73230 RepID=A0A2B7Z4X3_9EURO|nr:hypothetical protein GX50_08851 [Emmonsia crescens]
MKRERAEKIAAVNKQQQKKIERELMMEEQRIEALFQFQMHSMIQNIEKTALLSEHVNLLAAEMNSEAADQKMRDFETQVNLTKQKKHQPSPEKAEKRDFEMIITSDEEDDEKEKEKKKEKNEK